jgi:hypothetical protein
MDNKEYFPMIIETRKRSGRTDLNTVADALAEQMVNDPKFVIDGECGKTKIVTTLLANGILTPTARDLELPDMEKLFLDFKARRDDDGNKVEDIPWCKTPFEDGMDTSLRAFWTRIIVESMKECLRVAPLVLPPVRNMDIDIVLPRMPTPLELVARPEADAPNNNTRQMDKLNKLARKQENRRRRN